jgi:hypothetical protein
MRHYATRREFTVSIPWRVSEKFQMTCSFRPQSAALTLYQKWLANNFLWGKVRPLVFMTFYGKNLEQIRTSETVCKRYFRMCCWRIHEPYIRLTWIYIVVAPCSSFFLFSTTHCSLRLIVRFWLFQLSPPGVSTHVTTREHPTAEGGTVDEKCPVILPKCPIPLYI